MFRKIFVRNDQVQFENLDLMGVVYNANYLSFYERARSQALEENGLSFSEVIQTGVGIAIPETHIKFRLPLRLHENFATLTFLAASSRSTIRVIQLIVKGHRNMSEFSHITSEEDIRKIEGIVNIAEIILVFVDVQKGKPTAIPKDVADKLGVPLDPKDHTRPEFGQIKMSFFQT